MDPHLGDDDFTQPSRPLADVIGMEPNFTWHDLPHPEPDIAHGVLELHERLTSPAQALELHVVMTKPSGVMVAWWELEDGTPLGMVEVGEA